MNECEKKDDDRPKSKPTVQINSSIWRDRRPTTDDVQFAYPKRAPQHRTPTQTGNEREGAMGAQCQGDNRFN